VLLLIINSRSASFTFVVSICSAPYLDASEKQSLAEPIESIVGTGWQVVWSVSLVWQPELPRSSFLLDWHELLLQFSFSNAELIA
jgi:hypothetical protein